MSFIKQIAFKVSRAIARQPSGVKYGYSQTPAEIADEDANRRRGCLLLCLCAAVLVVALVFDLTGGRTKWPEPEPECRFDVHLNDRWEGQIGPAAERPEIRSISP